MPGRHSAYDGSIADLSTLPFSFVYDETHWTSYVYFDPEKDCGGLFVFRMEEAVERSCLHRLTMLNREHKYQLRDADKGVIGTFEGSELAKGYTVTHPRPRSAARDRSCFQFSLRSLGWGI